MPRASDIRSCTVAVKLVATPPIPVNVAWKSKNATYAARCQRALVLDGTKAKQLRARDAGIAESTGWQNTFPQITGFVQHDVTLLRLARPQRRIHDKRGWGRATDKSWSSIVVGYARLGVRPHSSDTGIKVRFRRRRQAQGAERLLD